MRCNSSIVTGPNTGQVTIDIYISISICIVFIYINISYKIRTWKACKVQKRAVIQIVLFLYLKREI